MITTKTDICIVGGGISGLYCAYKLIQKFPKKKIFLFESLSKLGGRVQTKSFCQNSFHPEFGSLQINSELQPSVTNLIHELELPTKAAQNYAYIMPINPNFERLHPEEQSLIQSNPKKSASILLLNRALQKVLGNQWDLKGDRWDLPQRDKKRKTLRKSATFNGIPLFDQGIWNVFSEVLSHEAIEFVREKGVYYNLKIANPNAADWILHLLNARLIKNPGHAPIGGMSSLIESLEKFVLEKKVVIHCNHELTQMKANKNGSIDLTFSKNNNRKSSTVLVNAKRVILTIPQMALQKVSDSLPPHIISLISTVCPVPIIWVYCVLENPPWKTDNPVANIENIPARTVFLELDQKNPSKYGMIGLYCDEPWYQYWAHLVCEKKASLTSNTHLDTQLNQGPRLKRALSKAISSLFNLKDPPKIVEWGIRDWGRPPFGGAIHLWKPYVQSEHVINRLKAFSLENTSALKNIHICNEAFSDLQGFLEGALRSADQVLQLI